jgi:hypothetical protein
MEDRRLSVCFIFETAERITIKFYIFFETLVVQCKVTTNVLSVKSKQRFINVQKYCTSCQTLIQVIK